MGFAFRQTLTNLISGIMIYTTKEYQPGSIVSVKLPGGEVTGKIEEINMKNLIMRSFDFKRIQFTPDLLPADILGGEIYNSKSQEFDIKI